MRAGRQGLAPCSVNGVDLRTHTPCCTEHAWRGMAAAHRAGVAARSRTCMLAARAVWPLSMATSRARKARQSWTSCISKSHGGKQAPVGCRRLACEVRAALADCSSGHSEQARLQHHTNVSRVWHIHMHVRKQRASRVGPAWPDGPGRQQCKARCTPAPPRRSSLLTTGGVSRSGQNRRGSSSHSPLRAAAL